MASRIKDMFLQVGFSSETAQLPVKKKGLHSSDEMHVITHKIVDSICNVIRMPGSKNVNRLPDQEQQVSVIAQENLKQAVFLFNHRWRCTFD